MVEPPRDAPPRGRPRPAGRGLRRARPALGGGAELRLAVALGRPRQGPRRPARRLGRPSRPRRHPLRLRGDAQPDAGPRSRTVGRLKQVLSLLHSPLYGRNTDTRALMALAREKFAGARGRPARSRPGPGGPSGSRRPLTLMPERRDNRTTLALNRPRRSGGREGRPLPRRPVPIASAADVN